MKNRESMSCSDWQEMLALMHEDDLSFAERVALNEHVDSCPTCAAVRAEYHAMRIHLRDLPAREPAPEFPERLLQLWSEQSAAGHLPEEGLNGSGKHADATRSLIPVDGTQRSLRPTSRNGRHLEEAGPDSGPYDDVQVDAWPPIKDERSAAGNILSIGHLATSIMSSIAIVVSTIAALGFFHTYNVLLVVLLLPVSIIAGLTAMVACVEVIRTMRKQKRASRSSTGNENKHLALPTNKRRKPYV